MKARLFLSALLSILVIVPAQAAQQNITILTGPKTGTYYAFGKDLTSVANKTLKITARESEGSVDNIKRLNSGNSMTLGIVQSDVLGFLNRSQNAQSKQTVSHLRMLFPLYQEEVHVLAKKEISDFSELQGKKVAIGEEGSGHMLTAVNLFAIEQIVPSEIRKISPEEGIVAVLKGDLDAVIFVGGKPVKIFKNIEDLTKPENQKFALLLQNVRFLPLNNARFYQEYEPNEITPKDYNFVKSTVPTISVQALLVSYEPQFSKDKSGRALQAKRCETLRQFTNAVKRTLPELQKEGHPKWKETNLYSDPVGWQKEDCIWKTARR